MPGSIRQVFLGDAWWYFEYRIKLHWIEIGANKKRITIRRVRFLSDGCEAFLQSQPKPNYLK